MNTSPVALAPHPQKRRTGLSRIVHATRYSIDGLLAAHGESAFRLETRLAAVMLPLAFWIGRSWVEVALLAGSVMLVLIVELLNSAVEAAIDRISLELHDLSKKAKDMGSAAVLLSVLLCAGIWLAAIASRWLI